MSRNDVTTAAVPQFAPLRNVLLARAVMETLTTRDPELPGMAVLYGPSGYGKTKAVSSVAIHHRAYYVECRSYFSKKSLLLAILDEMAIKPGRTVHEMVTQISEQLVHSRRPLMIDEMDHIVERNLVELVRDIYEASRASILMVGEENFPRKLRRWERFDNRILVWQPAEPSDLEDARKCAKLYAPDVVIADDLLARIVQETRGVTRRICVNIANVRREAKKAGLPPQRPIDLKAWGSRALYTGEAPLRRAA